MEEEFALTIEGMSVNQVFEQAVKANLPASDAAVLVSSWIFQNFGKTKRTFNYAQAFASVDAGCAPAFQRSFFHEDWTDGESVVQAEETSGELGFNLRFHQIETDIDNLNKDVKQALTCLAEMRLALRSLLDEIRAEFNRLNADVFESSQGSDGAVIGPARPPFIGLIDQNKFLGTAVINEKSLGMWQTPQGVMMLPQTFAPRFGPDDRRVADPGRFAKFSQQERVRDAFTGQQVTKEVMIEKFGNELTEDGVLVRQLVRILPDGATYGTIDEMMNDLTERNAAVIRTTPGASDAVALTLGITETATGDVREATVDQLATTPANVRVALQRQGFDTVGNLADATASRIVEAVRAEGLQISVGDAAELQATALTLSRIGRLHG